MALKISWSRFNTRFFFFFGTQVVRFPISSSFHILFSSPFCSWFRTDPSMRITSFSEWFLFFFQHCGLEKKK